MRKIRRKVFETNSSSMHAISIGGNKPIRYVPEVLNFYFGEFGWEDSYADPADYLYTAVYGYFGYNDDLINQWLNYISETLAKRGCKAVFHTNPPSAFWEHGYIDHSSELYELFEYLSDEEHLLGYLFGNTCIKTGNDNNDYGVTFESNEDTAMEILKAN